MKGRKTIMAEQKKASSSSSKSEGSDDEPQQAAAEPFEDTYESRAKAAQQQAEDQSK